MAFINVASQRDNLGDSLLRRPLIRAAQADGVCHVFVGAGAEQWDNLDLRPGDRTYAERKKWYFALLKSATVGPTNLVLNAGELVPDKRFHLSRILMLPAIALVRLRGGSVIHAGFGFRDPKARVPHLAKSMARRSDVTSWRDEASRAAAGVGTAAPDWAFAEGASIMDIEYRHSHREDKKTLALSFRGDRPLPGKDWVDGIRKIASDSLNADIVVVCQVRRDAERAEWLAKELNATLIDWPEHVTHSEQESRVREAYARSAWVASDRLHAVIMAVTEGAVPLDLVPIPSGKVARALAVLDLALLPAETASVRLEADASDLRRALGAARDRLTDLQNAIRVAMRHERQRVIRVLHTMAAPGTDTRYSRHMAATEDFDIRPVYLSWKSLFQRFDVLHVHWPEHFSPDGPGLRNWYSRFLSRRLVGRVKRKALPVIRTLHNITPHRRSTDDRGAKVRNLLNQITQAEIHLVPGDPNISRGEIRLIPHGSYREPYADIPNELPTPGRLLHFGRIDAYKGIPDLLSAAADSVVRDIRIVGSVQDANVARVITQTAQFDPRVSYKFGFVPDDELGSEIKNSELCVFPYRELHSSGAVLVALSLSRPILVPRSATTEALRDEVGADWVWIYDNLDAAELERATEWASNTLATGTRPRLNDRTWQDVRYRHGAVVRRVVQGTSPGEARDGR